MGNNRGYYKKLSVPKTATMVFLGTKLLGLLGFKRKKKV
jgi:hypothetical protein